MEKKILFFVAAITLSMASAFAQYDINLSSNPFQGGFVSGGGNYPYGAEITVSAIPDSLCYTFVYWSEEGVIITTDPFFTFTVTQSHNLVANFVEIGGPYTVTLSASPSEGGSVYGGSYNIPCGTEITVCATPDTYFTFINWTVNGVEVSTELCYTFTVNQSLHLVANFGVGIYDITVTTEPTECGEVTGGGVNLPYGSIVSVCAIPSICCDFLYWTAEGLLLSNDNCYSFVVTHSMNLVAHFEKKNFDVIISSNPQEGGEVSGGGNNISCGDSTFVWAHPGPNYEFVNWTEDDEEVSDNALYAFPVFQSHSLAANFVETGKTYVIIVLPNLKEGGTAYGSEENVPYGEKITVSASANTDYCFVNWTKNSIEVSTNIEYSFSVTEDVELIANFEKANITNIETIGTSAIKIYPNPSGGELKVVSGGLKVENIEIYDSFGKRVSVNCASDTETTIDIKYLSAGLYFVKVMTDYGEVIQKVVKE